jgi:hypothetical protein
MALGSFSDPALQERALAYSLEGPLRPNEVMRIARSLGGQGEAERERVWGWVAGNFDALRRRIPVPYLVFLAYAAAGCSENRVREAEAFFAEPAHAIPGIEKELAKVSEGVGACVGLRDREGPAVTAYLREMGRARE